MFIHWFTIEFFLHYIFNFIPHFIICFQQFFIFDKTRHWLQWLLWFNFIVNFVSKKEFKTFIILNLVRCHYLTIFYLMYTNQVPRFVQWILFNHIITNIIHIFTHLLCYTIDKNKIMFYIVTDFLIFFQSLFIFIRYISVSFSSIFSLYIIFLIR